MGVMSEMHVVGVGLAAPSGQPVLLLRDSAAVRYLPISIGRAEAVAIGLAQQGVLFERPLTHTLIVDVAKALGRQLRQVLITDIVEGTFFAELVFTDDTRVSARPSDAVALALRSGAAIHAAEDVLAAAGVASDQVLVEAALVNAAGDPAAGDPPDEGSVEEEIEEFRAFLHDARPEDFGG